MTQQQTVKAAQEIVENLANVKDAFITDGVYETIAEQEYHSVVLTDDGIDELVNIIVNNGVHGLVAHSHHTDEDVEYVAEISPLENTTSANMEELVNRLDDGNELPGFFLDYHDENGGMYTLYADGF